jgi:hypothetical protein
VQRVSPLSPIGRRMDELTLRSDAVGALDLRVITQ